MQETTPRNAQASPPQKNTQQHHLNTRSTVWLHQHQKYVLWDHFEYTKIKHSEIPPGVIMHYQLDCIAHHDGYVYIEIRKGMPGLKQAGKNSQWQARRTPWKILIRTLRPYTSPLETQNKKHHLCPCRGQLLCKICWQRKFYPSCINIKRLV